MTQIQKPQKQSFLLVEFLYGDPRSPTYSRFTDQSSDVDALGVRWTAVPDMEVRVPSNIGTLADKQLELEMKLQSGFLTDVSGGEPHSPVVVTVREMSIATDDGSGPQIITLFAGRLINTRRNPASRTESVRLIAVHSKARLAIALGMPANHHCVWTFTGRGCAVSPVALAETGTITSIIGKVATITGLADHSADTTGRYWHMGYLEIAGLRITIRDWQIATPTVFQLAKEPPAGWASASVSVFPGCDKTIETCRARWDNEENFGGFGYAVPAYHPVYENPG